MSDRWQIEGTERGTIRLSGLLQHAASSLWDMGHRRIDRPLVEGWLRRHHEAHNWGDVPTQIANLESFYGANWTLTGPVAA